MCGHRCRPAGRYAPVRRLEETAAGGEERLVLTLGGANLACCEVDLGWDVASLRAIARERTRDVRLWAARGGEALAVVLESEGRRLEDGRKLRDSGLGNMSLVAVSLEEEEEEEGDQ